MIKSLWDRKEEKVKERVRRVSLRGRVNGAPNPIDVHVGKKVRLRRTMLGMSQEELGKALSLTFQQVQKYESGMNRIGASRLWDLSQVLNTPVSYFYDGLGETAKRCSPRHLTNETERAAVLSEDIVEIDDKPLMRRETLELVRAYYRIPDRLMAKRVADLIKALATPLPEGEEEEDIDDTIFLEEESLKAAERGKKR